MSRTELLTGNEAAARAVRVSKPQVIPTYPITPQSPMLEIIARDVEKGLLRAEFLNMESDYAAMAAASLPVRSSVRLMASPSSSSPLDS